MIYKHRKVLTESGKPVDMNVTFIPKEALPSADIPSQVPNLVPEMGVVPGPHRQPFSNLNEVIDAQLEVQAKLTELKLLREMSINSLSGNPETEHLKQQFEAMKEEKIQNGFAELKDMILAMSEQSPEGEGDSKGMENMIGQIIAQKMAEGGQQPQGPMLH